MMKLPLYSRTVASQEKVRNKEQYVSRLQDRDPKTVTRHSWFINKLLLAILQFWVIHLVNLSYLFHLH